MVSYSNKTETELSERNDDMAKTEAQIRATKKYDKKTYYRPTILLRREYEEQIHDRAKDLNMSMSSYILELIKKDLDSHIL